MNHRLALLLSILIACDANSTGADSDTGPSLGPEDCADDIDNDGDGDVDCQDDDCLESASCAEECDDGMDNDGDGDVDCDDSDCLNEPSCGRPFVIDQEQVVAPTQRRRDWAGPVGRTSPSPLGAILSARWAHLGQKEHASVASFASITLQLLAFGAPAELVEATQRSAADEVEHARLCFGLAAAFGGAEIGPGRLSMTGFELQLEPERVLDALIQEACVGETLSALEACEAHDRATDPAVRDVLARIAEDEQRHARLAWRTLAWLLTEHPELASRAAAAFGRAAVAPERSEATGGLEPFGLLDAATSRAVRHAGLRDVVRPAANALLHRHAGTEGASPIREAAL